MNGLLAGTSLIILTLMACSAPPPRPGAPREDRLPATGSDLPQAATDVAVPTAGVESSTPETDQAAVLADQSRDCMKVIWRDPAFQRRFAESYLSETEIEPSITPEERDHLQEVAALMASEKLGEAAGLLERLRGAGATAVFDFMLGNIDFQQDRLAEAAAAYKVAVEKFPRFRRAWRNLGLVAIRQIDFDEAVRAITRVIELGGQDGLTYGLLGYAYASLGKNVSAESVYRLAVILDPTTMDWKMGLARSLFKQERYATAAALCDGLIADNPDRTDLWLLQAGAFLGLDQPLKAAENYEMVNHMGRATADSLNMLGDIYTNQDLFTDAVEAYVRALEKSPNGRPQHALRAAKIMVARGGYTDARELIETIETRCGDRLEIDQRKDLLKVQARIAVAEGGTGEDARVLKEIVRLDPLDGQALILLGQYYRRAGEFEQAVFYYERAESLDDFEADARVRHAQVLVGQGRYAEALPLLQRAQAIKPRENIREYVEQVERVARHR